MNAETTLPSAVASPHPRGFLAFACAVLEAREDSEIILPSNASPEDLEQIMGPAYLAIDQWVREDHAERYAAYAGLRNAHALAMLEKAGVPPEAFKEPNGALRGAIAAQEYAFNALFPPAEQPPRRRVGSELYRPDRRLVVSAIASTYVSLGRYRQTHTGKMLSRNIPTADLEKYTVTRLHVRTALVSVSKYVQDFQSRSDADRVVLYANVLLRQAAGLEAVWRAALKRTDFATARFPMAGRYIAMRQDGQLLPIYEEAASKPPLPADLHGAAAALAQLPFKALQKELNWRQRAAKKGIFRPADMPSQRPLEPGHHQLSR
jgi:hypothetical protein